MTGRTGLNHPCGPKYPAGIEPAAGIVEDSATFRAFARTSQDRLAYQSPIEGTEPP